MIILGIVKQPDPPPYWRVKAVSVKYPDGKRHMIWKKGDLATLALEHPEVITQLGG